MAKFKNITTKTQGVYTRFNQLIMVEPGEQVDDDKLGREPTLEEGFSKVSILGAIFGKEAKDSKKSPSSERLESGAVPPIIISAPKGSKPTGDFHQENTPSLNKAIEMLLEGKTPSEQLIVNNAKGDPQDRLTAVRNMNQETFSQLPPPHQRQIREEMDDIELAVPEVDPLLIPTPKEIEKAQVTEEKPEESRVSPEVLVPPIIVPPVSAKEIIVDPSGNGIKRYKRE